jgi:hypothetical protein
MRQGLTYETDRLVLNDVVSMPNSSVVTANCHNEPEEAEVPKALWHQNQSINDAVSGVAALTHTNDRLQYQKKCHFDSLAHIRQCQQKRKSRHNRHVAN